jgi:hypothetical protein
VPHHVGGDIAGVATQPAGQRQRSVCLEVRVLRPADARVSRRSGRRLEGGREPVVQQLFQVPGLPWNDNLVQGRPVGLSPLAHPSDWRGRPQVIDAPLVGRLRLLVPST